MKNMFVHKSSNKILFNIFTLNLDLQILAQLHKFLPNANEINFF